jgi:hypothetical protein
LAAEASAKAGRSPVTGFFLFHFYNQYFPGSISYPEPVINSFANDPDNFAA